MATVTHRSDAIRGLLRFPTLLKGEVIKLGLHLAADADPQNLERLEVVSCGTDVWGIDFCYRFDGTKATFNKFKKSLVHRVKSRVDSVHWSITSDVVVIKHPMV